MEDNEDPIEMEDELEDEFSRDDSYSLRYIQTHECMQAHEDMGSLVQGEIDQVIRAAKRQMQIHYNLQAKYAAGAGKTNDGTAARKEIAKYWG